MKQATIHQLHVLEAIARHNSFTRAAEELNLTQPTVSQQMKQLTKIVGIPLVEQLGKRFYLTEAGKEVLAASQEISSRLELLESSLNELKGLEKGHLSLATTTTAKYFVPRLLGTFKRQHPAIELSLNITNQAQVLDRLAHNQDDLYFTGRPPKELDIELRPILPNPLVVVAPSNHPLAREQKTIPLKRLIEEQFIMREPGSGTRAIVEQFFADNRLEINTVMEMSSNEAIKQGIAGGLGLSVLSLHCLSLAVPGGPLTFLNVEGFPIQQQWYVVYPSGKQLSLAAQTFLDFLLNEGKAIVEGTLEDLSNLNVLPHPQAIDPISVS
ncbi:LysR substrate-binding domain-containing protein [Chamaesiphon sp. VAR_48_metabat_403]|uniref:LysR family transcriptional regulator n=1 Tax=Chamaesiphon sp. VAR_48_metabat_403 TaxID=2964700 RepID=UPI00286E6DC5|nr:LysR substrate-binding domain-containing protein [Chamaesiphon sp. VAR_48_metabat_403]